MDRRNSEVPLRIERDRGVWPVTSVSTDRYRRFRDAVLDCIDRDGFSSDHTIRLLDIGASSGEALSEFATSLAPMFSTPLSTIGVDPQRALLKGNRTLRHSEYAVQALGQYLPFQDASCDIIVSKKLLHFLPQEHQSYILREIDRIITTDGVVALEFDPQASSNLGDSVVWILDAQALHRLRNQTDGFHSYPFYRPPGVTALNERD